MPYIPFTDEQKVLANSVDLEQFLRMRGEKLERVGREHKLIYCDSSGRHDSITIRGSKWFDHKDQTCGGAIKFMQEFYGMDFQTAVQELLGRSISPLSNSPPKADKQKTREFKLPEPNSDMHRVYAYLINSGLSRLTSSHTLPNSIPSMRIKPTTTQYLSDLMKMASLSRHISGQQTALEVRFVSLAAVLIPVTALHISEKMNDFMYLKLP